MLQDYVNDPPTDGWSTLLEWCNPQYAGIPVLLPERQKRMHEQN
jgi:hypothetical protein